MDDQMKSPTMTIKAPLAVGIAILAGLLVLGCKVGGGTDDCPQCNSHCRLSAWPRLIAISVTDQQQVLCADPRTLNICPG